ncbi:MAG: hypothetical protein ABII25_06790 [bacterium]
MRNRIILQKTIIVLLLVLFNKPVGAEDVNFYTHPVEKTPSPAGLSSETSGDKKALLILKYENSLLSADIKSATIKDIFEELKKQTGINYEIEKEIAEQKTTISLKDKKIEEAIKEILNTKM